MRIQKIDKKRKGNIENENENENHMKDGYDSLQSKIEREQKWFYISRF